MTASQTIVLATPVFLLLIAVEFAVGWRRQKRGTGAHGYGFADAINSLSLGMLSQTSAVFTALLRIGIYTLVYRAVAVGPGPEFWQTWYGWLLALVFYDFCYYWLHRAGHEVGILWAAHAVHHQSQHYNLTTALRQTSSGALLGWIFYVPMAVAGVPPLVFAIVGLVDLLYQFWVHTEQVGKLGWFDRWFCSPSNHRVHHAVNDRYLDRNYGGIWMVWDRLFGSFEDETEKPVYGIRGGLESCDPLYANAQVYWGMAQDSWRARSWADKLRVWWKPPGWRPPDVAARWPKPAFDIERFTRWAPPMGRAAQWAAGIQFAVLLACIATFLWVAEVLPGWHAAVWLCALVAAQWGLGALVRGRIGVLQLLAIDAMAIATAAAALQIGWLYAAAKPAALLLAIAFVAARAGWMRSAARYDWILLAALVFSLGGDVALLWPREGFVPGLASFLVAHLLYIALFRQDAPWFPGRTALAATLGIGGAMYAVLWATGLPPALRVPVALYVLAIACMAAQAIGRAVVVRTGAALGVAIGAATFMASDAILAFDRFVAPQPWAAFGILSTYYLAQMLIAHHARPGVLQKEELPEQSPRGLQTETA